MSSTSFQFGITDQHWLWEPRERIALLLACLVFVVSGCGGVFDFGSNPLTPGSSWAIQAVDGLPAPNNAPVVLSIAADGESATVRGPCGRSFWTLVYDSDGRALNFVAQGDNAARKDCSESEFNHTLFVEEGLRGVERWDQAGSGFELNGAARIRIERLSDD